MPQKKKILALIAARSGSKRVKGKNIKLLHGKPLIAYTIEAAQKSRLITRVIVTTDSQEIARIARKYGAETPYLRPARIAKGSSTEYEFHQHAIDWLKHNEGYEPDVIVNLYPTTPFRMPSTIDNAIHVFLKHPLADSLRSVTKCSEHPYKMWRVQGDYLKPFVQKKDSGNHTLSYQSLPEIYIQNASIYITSPRTLRKYKSTVGKKVLRFIMDADESLDINSMYDFMLAELFLNKKR